MKIHPVINPAILILGALVLVFAPHLLHITLVTLLFVVGIVGVINAFNK